VNAILKMEREESIILVFLFLSCLWGRERESRRTETHKKTMGNGLGFFCEL